MVFENKLSEEIEKYILAQALKKKKVGGPKYKPVTWLTDAAKRAKQIRRVTHPIKFTHTASEGTSVFVGKASQFTDYGTNYVSTVSLDQVPMDFDGNAAAHDVSNFLRISVGGVRLVDQIEAGDGSSLAPFAENDPKLVEDWLKGFMAALTDKELRSHTRAKQLYFPVEGAYHLIGPLHASSLAEVLLQAVASSRYTKESKLVRKAKKDNKFSEKLAVYFSNTAVQTHGGSNQQNVSLLNSGRGGKSFLLSCQAPVWHTRELPPSKYKNSFWRGYERWRGCGQEAWRTAKKLQTFLLEKIDQNNTVAIRNRREELVDELMDILVQYAASIQSLKEHAGWSTESKLSPAEQLWLDPFRPDPEFQEQRSTKDWQQDIANQFASWLSHKLKHDKLAFGDVEYREWSRLLERKLSLLKEDLKVLAE